jgi:4-hydroxybenzoyl-CoA thioesterase
MGKAAATRARPSPSRASGNGDVTNFVFRRELTIEWGHCDPAGIVFNSRFFEYFDWNTGLLFQAALGLKKFDMIAEFEADMPLVDARARFIKPAKFGDVVEIASYISEFRRSSFDVKHELFLMGQLAVDAQETRVWIGRDLVDPSKIKAKPIPPEVTERFKLQ